MRKFLAIAFSLVIGLTGCTTSKPHVAITRTSARATPPAVKRIATPTASTQTCVTSAKFCVTLPASVTTRTFSELRSTAKTTLGLVPSHDFYISGDAHSIGISVYTPRTKDPRAAANAALSFNWNRQITTFKGDPAVRTCVRAQKNASDCPHDGKNGDYTLKVAHGGLVYDLFYGPGSKADADAFFNSLTFTA